MENVAKDTLKLVEEQMNSWDIWRRRRMEAPPSVRKPVVADFVSISRIYGSGGSDVAYRLGERVGWPVFDKQILQEMAGSDDLRRRVYASMDERDMNWFQEFIGALWQSAPARDDYFHRLSETILSLARQGRGVFLGRAADLILPRDCGLRVRIEAPRELCVRRFAEREGLTPAEAHREVDRVERDRVAFLRNHFNVNPYDPTRYDLVLNMERFTVEQSVELVVQAMRLRGIRDGEGG